MVWLNLSSSLHLSTGFNFNVQNRCNLSKSFPWNDFLLDFYLLVHTHYTNRKSFYLFFGKCWVGSRFVFTYTINHKFVMGLLNLMVYNCNSLCLKFISIRVRNTIHYNLLQFCTLFWQKWVIFTPLHPLWWLYLSEDVEPFYQMYNNRYFCQMRKSFVVEIMALVVFL